MTAAERTALAFKIKSVFIEQVKLLKKNTPAENRISLRGER